MNDSLYTQGGERPDLAILEVNPPEGFIGAKIIPHVAVSEKSGSCYYATVTADQTAQSNRSVGNAPTAVQIATSNTTYTVTENCLRAKVSPDEAKSFGGIQVADQIGAKFAKRQVMNALEALVRNATIGQTATKVFDPAKILGDIQTALQSVRLYEGKKTLVASTSTVKLMVQQLMQSTKWGPTFSRIISGSTPAIAVQGMSLASWISALEIFLDLDQILLGDDNIWNATNYSGKFAIVKVIDDGDALAFKYRPVFARNFQFIPSGSTNPWIIQTVADRVSVNNLYDAYLWSNIVTFNSGALYVFEGVTG